MTPLHISDDWAGTGVSSSRLQLAGIVNYSILSGNAQVIVTFADESTYGEELTLYIDGQICYATRAFPEENRHVGASKEVGTFGIETNWYQNGSHLLEVKDRFGNLRARRVIFHNIISEVDLRSALDAEPASDSEFPYHLTAVLSYPQAWQVSLEGIDGLLVKQLEGYGSCIDAVWDGTDMNGQMADASPYQVSMKAVESSVTVIVGCINQLT